MRFNLARTLGISEPKRTGLKGRRRGWQTGPSNGRERVGVGGSFGFRDLFLSFSLFGPFEEQNCVCERETMGIEGEGILSERKKKKRSFG